MLMAEVIEQSLEIMHWALAQHDPDNWLGPDSAALIEENDQVFKVNLDRYKYAIRYPEQPMEHYRAQGAAFLQRLEVMLEQTPYLAGDTLSLADIALAPFVRQFAHVDRDWFEQAPYPHLNAWLERFLASALFGSVMKKTWNSSIWKNPRPLMAMSSGCSVVCRLPAVKFFCEIGRAHV